MKLALQAFDIAFANIVFPQPGGPYIKIPAVCYKLNLLQSSGFYNGESI